eukprot:gene5925-33498_t
MSWKRSRPWPPSVSVQAYYFIKVATPHPRSIEATSSSFRARAHSATSSPNTAAFGSFNRLQSLRTMLSVTVLSRQSGVNEASAQCDLPIPRRRGGGIIAGAKLTMSTSPGEESALCKPATTLHTGDQQRASWRRLSDLAAEAWRSGRRMTGTTDTERKIADENGKSR